MENNTRDWQFYIKINETHWKKKTRENILFYSLSSELFLVSFMAPCFSGRIG
jgi:hypothetical protein